MSSPPPLGAISSGIRYQVRFFWRQALPMLFPKPVVRQVVLEHRDVDVVDDVVVCYVSPGINDRGSKVTVDFHQLKYHVAQSGAVDHESIVDPAWTGTRVCILKRLADAWTDVTEDEPSARLTLVTIWAWDPRALSRAYSGMASVSVTSSSQGVTVLTSARSVFDGRPPPDFRPPSSKRL
jgi:hypothetical protein